VILVSGCAVTYPLDYTVQISECGGSLPDGYYNLSRSRMGFALNYTRSYHCAGSELSVSAYLNGSSIIIAEELAVGQTVTSCACPRMIAVEFKYLRPGNYTVEVRSYNYMYTGEPAFARDIVV
jgi:hypothetical protein